MNYRTISITLYEKVQHIYRLVTGVVEKEVLVEMSGNFTLNDKETFYFFFIHTINGPNYVKNN